MPEIKKEIINLINNIRENSLLLNSIIISEAFALASLMRYVLHMGLTRILSKALYGEFAVLIGIATILSVPISSLQTVLAREISKLDGERKYGEINYIFRKYSKMVLIAGAFATLLIALFGILLFFAKPSCALSNDSQCKAFNYLLNLIPVGNPLFLALIAPLFLSAFIFAVICAYYQGRENPISLSNFQIFYYLAGIAGALILATISFEFSLLAYSILPLLVILIYYVMLRKETQKTKQIEVHFAHESMILLFSFLLLNFFFYEDLFMVKRLLSDEAAGAYNVASMSARLIYYFALALCTVYLPYATKQKIGKELFFSSVKVMLLPLPAFLLFILFPEKILSLFYGASYAEGAMAFRLLSAAYLLISGGYVFLTALWSQKEEKIPFLFLLAVTLANLPLLNYFIGVYGMMGAAISTLVSGFLFFLLFSSYSSFLVASKK